ncbi:MAG: hypothetical protein B7Y33_06085 [Hydrogenophilales bacterium 16-62-9]|nr:MAG: hypothetical protein B7Y33_06085 [Hydrogenophilales bacterium 16-62-9]
MSWLDYVQNRLREMQPASVYALEASAFQLVTRTLPKTPVNTPGDASGSPFTLAVGVNALKGLNAIQARQLISQTRIYVAPRLLLVEGADCALDAALNIHDYDLATYKPVPDWLNARYWAHPERWKP